MCMFIYLWGRGQLSLGFPCLCLLSSWVTVRPQCLFNVCVGSGEPYFGSLACTRSTLFIDTTPRSLYCTFKAESQEQPTQSDLQSEKYLISLEVETSGSCQIYKSFQEVLRESLKKWECLSPCSKLASLLHVYRIVFAVGEVCLFPFHSVGNLSSYRQALFPRPRSRDQGSKLRSVLIPQLFPARAGVSLRHFSNNNFRFRRKTRQCFVWPFQLADEPSVNQLSQNWWPQDGLSPKPSSDEMIKQDC